MAVRAQETFHPQQLTCRTYFGRAAETALLRQTTLLLLLLLLL
jgi:hypothetical protein